MEVIHFWNHSSLQHVHYPLALFMRCVVVKAQFTALAKQQNIIYFRVWIIVNTHVKFRCQHWHCNYQPTCNLNWMLSIMGGMQQNLIQFFETFLSLTQRPMEQQLQRCFSFFKAIKFSSAIYSKSFVNSID